MPQESVSQRSIFIVNAPSVPTENLAKKGAERVKVRYLVDERHGSDRFALRLYTVEKGGHTPVDQHAYEHQVYVLSGQGLLRQSNNSTEPSRTLVPGDTLFIPSNAVHSFSNEREEPFLFLCVKGNPSLYLAHEVGHPPGEDSLRKFC